jgi:fumarate reductase subunit C
MARPANPHAMAPSRPGPTRTAPPQVPDDFWTRPRMRTYLLFDATGVVYLCVGLVALRVAWALAAGPDAWQALMTSFSHPLYVAFHALALAAALFVGVRFFRLFPKAQPARIGPAKPPPRPVLQAMLYAAWGAITLGLLVVLGGIWPS